MVKRAVRCALALACVALLLPSRARAGSTNPPAGDAVKLIADLHAAIAAGAKTFTVPPDDYHFGAADAPNLVVDSANGLRIDANGANFWFDGSVRRDGLLFRNCRHVVMSGGTIDFDKLRYTQGRVVSVDPPRRVLRLRLDPGYPLPDHADTDLGAGNVKAVYFTPDGALKPVVLDWVSALSPIPGADGEYNVGFKAERLFTEPGDVRPGDRMALPFRSGRMAVLITNSEDVTLENLTVYAAPQMALTETGGVGGHTYRHCRVVRRPGSDRLLTTNADVFHSIGVVRGPTIEGCEFADAADDLINIHALAAPVWERIAPDRVVVFADDASVFAVGAEISFYGFDSAERIGTARVTAVAPRPDLADSIPRLPTLALLKLERIVPLRPQAKALELTLDQPVAAERFDFAFSGQGVAAGTRIEDNDLHDTLGRAVLLKVMHATVARNRIARTGLPGIMLATDRYFLEGPPPSDVTVRDNELTDVARAVGSFNGPGWHAGIAAWCDAGKRDAAPITRSRPLNGLHIENNHIRGAGRNGIFLADATASTVVGNTVSGLNAADGKRHAISILYSDTIRVDGNTLDAKKNDPTATLLDLGPETSAVGPAH